MAGKPDKALAVLKSHEEALKVRKEACARHIND
jgi:hypothetical protein